MKLMIIFLLIIFLYALWKYVLQSKFQGFQGSSSFDLIKLIKPAPKVASEVRIPMTEIVNEDDVRLFDDVAKLLFEKAYQNLS